MKGTPSPRFFPRDICPEGRYKKWVMDVFHTESEQETQALAAKMAGRARAGDVFLLDAPMGAGKSAFARGFIRALCGADTDVPSPTYTLVQTYDAPSAAIWHFDLYRLEDPQEVLNIGWEDALAGDSICLIEWPEKAGPYLPRRFTRIRITPTKDQSRTIEVSHA
jgi:tRNA threonylcarbamoyladenosine biosynthesis protein TsaE